MPISLLEHVGGQVILVEALLNRDDTSRCLVVEAAQQGVVEPVAQVLPFDSALCLVGLHAIIDDDDVGSKARD